MAYDRCLSCSGAGRTICSSCGGRGSRSCSACGGRGRWSENNWRNGMMNTDYFTCSSCGGTGNTFCLGSCSNGQVNCSACSGSGTRWVADPPPNFNSSPKYVSNSGIVLNNAPPGAGPFTRPLHTNPVGGARTRFSVAGGHDYSRTAIIGALAVGLVIGAYARNENANFSTTVVAIFAGPLNFLRYYIGEAVGNPTVAWVTTLCVYLLALVLLLFAGVGTILGYLGATAYFRFAGH